MGIRQDALLRYAASLVLIVSSLLFLIFVGTFYSSNSFLTRLLTIIYFFAFIEGILLLFPLRHTLLGIVLIVESGYALIIDHNYSAINFLPLAVGGILAIIYKPAVTEPVNHPKNARRLISLGAYLILFAMLIDIILVIQLISLLNFNAIYISKGQMFMLLASVMAYTIIAVLVFLFTIFVSFRLKTKDKSRVNRYSKIAFFVGIFSIIIILAASSLLSNYLLSILSKQQGDNNMLSFMFRLNISSSNLFLSNNGLFLIDYYARIIGLVFVFLGALLGLAYSKDLKLVRYISVNRRVFLYPIIIIIVAGVSLSYYSNYYITSHNELALRFLNNEIRMYGSNLRYMLANQSEYNNTIYGKGTYLSLAYWNGSILYKTLVSMSNSQSNISSMPIFDSSGASLTVPTHGINRFDFYKDTFMDKPILSELSNLGELDNPGVVIVATGSNLPNYTSMFLENEHIIVPKNTSTLRAMYTLSGVEIDEFLVVDIFYNFVLRQTNSNSITVNNSAINSGIGIGFVAGSDKNPVATTTLLNGSFYDIASLSQESNNYIVERYMKSGFFKGRGFSGIDNATYLNNLFYMLSLNQYMSFFTSEIFYNKTIEPNIDFFGYLNNTSIINLGNLNLNNPNITVYIDGNLSNYKRYYNYLIVYNKHLSIGYHKIKVVIGNSSLSALVYISPTLPIVSFSGDSHYQVVEPIEEYNNSSHNYSSCNNKCFVLSLNILNSYSTPLVVENVSITGGVNPMPSVTPTNISKFTYNWSANYTKMPILIDVNYSRFKEMYLHNNYTDINYTKANYTTYNIPKNTSYEINRNDFLTLNYLIFSCIAEEKYYTLTFNTNYGEVHSIISANCPST
jgi:hypothetical protein